MHIYLFIVCHLDDHYVHSYLIYVVLELLVLSFSSAGELGTIFLSSKFHFKAFNSFSCVFYSWYCTYVSALLNFYLVCFWCYFPIVLHMFFLIINLILVVTYLIGFFCLFIIFSCDIILDCYVGLVVIIFISSDFIA